MKNFIKICIALMLMAGTVGAVNFVKMYRTGEIEKIYVQKEKAAPVQKTESPIPVVNRTPPVIESLVSAKTGKTEPVTSSIAVKEDSEAKLSNEPVEPANTATLVSITSEGKPGVASRAAKPVIKASKRKFSMRMYSRAAMVEEPIEMDSISAVSMVDTTAKAVNP